VDAAAPPTLVQLFKAFLEISLSAFGGALPFARRTLVDRRRWLGPEQFTELLSLCQFIPGGNVHNLGIVLGSRARGVPGALAAALGFIGVPFVIILAVGAGYQAIGTEPMAQRALSGLTAAAAGLLIATALKMLEPILRRRSVAAVAMVALTTIAVAIVGLPLVPVLLVLTPLSILVCGRVP
jgi:chromate transporter